LTDGIAREFVIGSVAFSDGSVGSAMLGLALKGRDIPAQGNALGQGSHHPQSPERAWHRNQPQRNSHV